MKTSFSSLLLKDGSRLFYFLWSWLHGGNLLGSQREDEYMYANVTFIIIIVVNHDGIKSPTTVLTALNGPFSLTNLSKEPGILIKLLRSS